ncbi:MAG: hypothetical protein RIR96_902 [Bacteroidota bacterium]|jgi:hypothetical protein
MMCRKIKRPIFIARSKFAGFFFCLGWHLVNVFNKKNFFMNTYSMIFAVPKKMSETQGF